MARCPWCGKDITTLDCQEEDAVVSYLFYLDGQRPVYSDMQVVSHGSENWLCTKCGRLIALTEDGAIAFLKTGRLPEEELALVVRRICGMQGRVALALFRNEQGVVVLDLDSHYYFEGRHTLELVRAWFSGQLIPIELEYCPEPVLFELAEFTDEDETFMRLVSALKSVPEPLSRKLCGLLARGDRQATLDRLMAVAVEIALS